MTNVLLVPVHLDALVLDADRLMVEAMADFARLPYVDQHLKREINADHANVSESIVSQPFQSQNLQLKSGVHLHWSMPDALTRGAQHARKTRFPPLPNRWLITRSITGTNRTSWVVESDFVLPILQEANPDYKEYVLVAGEQSGGISYFYREIDPDSAEPFRCVGRQLPLDVWINESQEQRAHREYFPANKPLTALGYGEIAFAAFYPNCHSVFGFHDADVPDRKLDYQYEIVGWHSHPDHDPLKRLLLGEAILTCFELDASKQDQDRATKTMRRDGLLAYFSFESKSQLSEIISGLIHGDSIRSELHEFLAHQLADFVSEGLEFFQEEPNRKFLEIDKFSDFDWALASKHDDTIPERALYYSSLSIPADSATLGNQECDVAGEVTITVGNTTMEALSAYLAHQLAGEFGIKPTDEDYAKRMERLEDQLESLHLSGKLSNRKLDIGPKFREARHSSGFTPVSSGLRWAVRRQSRFPESVTPPAGRENGNAAGELQHSSVAHAQAQRSVVLPPEMTAQLSELNDFQDQYDTAQQKIGDCRKQLFSDWYKYMMSAYHPADTVRGDDYPDVDEVKFFIEETGIKPLERIMGTIKKIESDLKGVNRQLQKLIDHYNHSLLVHLQPDDAASLADFAGDKLRFSMDPEADSSNTNPAFAQCLSFDGETGYAVIWKAPPPNARRGVTLSAWVKPVLGMSGARTVFAIGDLMIKLQPVKRGMTDRLAVGCPGVDERIGVISPGRWHHLAITCEDTDAPSLVIYIDGRRFPLQPSLDVSKKLKNFAPLFIGAGQQDDTTGYQGKMTQVRVDNRALLPAEVRRDMNGGVRPVYQLYTKAAPRCWQPNEPVVLMVGKGIRASERHGRDGRLRDDGALECPVLRSSSEDLTALEAIMTRKADGVSGEEDFAGSVRAAFESVPSKAIAQSESKGQPWHPIMLEWEALLQPARGTKGIEGAAFAPDVVTANYDLHDNAVDLKVKSDRNNLAAGTVYSNRCYLTPHGSEQLQQRIAEYFKAFLDDLREKIYEFKDLKEHDMLPADEALNRYHEALTTWVEGERPEPVLSNGVIQLTGKFLKTLKEWYGRKPTYDDPAEKTFDTLLPAQKADDPVYVVICAGLSLFDEDGVPLTFLSQSLGGFNDELLMHKRTMQLPVADPLGFDDYQRFTDTVAELLGDTIHSAPEPTNQFNPIRTGAMSFTRLRLIDTFGQVKDFNEEAILAAGHEIITPQRLMVPDSPHLIWMPPRLVQPARVDFRWLRAAESDLDATPICGWVLPNNLQKALAVYDHRGRALGSILQRGSTIQWEPAPGRNREVDEIENPHLKKMVRYILNKGDSPTDQRATDENFLEDFLTALESALETIDPESHAQHRSLALLLGRPIAVVRASLDLQLQGAPAAHQGWHAFQQDLRRDTRETDDFTGVQFPIRLGEYQQLNDGVVGYWIEEGDSYKDDKFYAPQTPDNTQNRSIDHPDIDIHTEDEPVHILQSIDSPKLTATLLFDPRGKVHLTSGVLPTKVIDIPAEEYAAALEAIEVTFLTAPVLTAHGTRSVALADEPGFAWSWLEHERWLDKKVFAECIDGQYLSGEADELWNRLTASGWIQPGKEGHHLARIIPMGRRTSEKLHEKIGESGKDRAILEDRIERLFWAEYSSASVMERNTFLLRLTALSGVSDENENLCRSVWNHLLEPGVHWLSAISEDPTRARVVAIDERREVVLAPPEDWLNAIGRIAPPIGEGENAAATATGKWVERILNTEALELVPVETQAGFDTEQEIREGWLVLKNRREET